MAAPSVSLTPGTADVYGRALPAPPAPPRPSAFQLASGAWMRDVLARALAAAGHNPETRATTLLRQAPILTPQARASMYGAAAAARSRARAAAGGKGAIY